MVVCNVKCVLHNVTHPNLPDVSKNSTSAQVLIEKTAPSGFRLLYVKALATILLQELKTLIFDYIKFDFIYSCFVCESVAHRL